MVEWTVQGLSNLFKSWLKNIKIELEIAQWESIYVPCLRPWVQLPELPPTPDP